MEMGVPVGQGAVGLETGDDPDPEIGLSRGGADAGGDDAGRQPRQVAEEGPAIEAVGPSEFSARPAMSPQVSRTDLECLLRGPCPTAVAEGAR